MEKATPSRRTNEWKKLDAYMVAHPPAVGSDLERYWQAFQKLPDGQRQMLIRCCINFHEGLPMNQGGIHSVLEILGMVAELVAAEATPKSRQSPFANSPKIG